MADDQRVAAIHVDCFECAETWTVEDVDPAWTIDDVRSMARNDGCPMCHADAIVVSVTPAS